MRGNKNSVTIVRQRPKDFDQHEFSCVVEAAGWFVEQEHAMPLCQLNCKRKSELLSG